MADHPKRGRTPKTPCRRRSWSSGDAGIGSAVHACPQALVLKICIECRVRRRSTPGSASKDQADTQAALEQEPTRSPSSLDDLAQQELARRDPERHQPALPSQAVAISLRVFEELPYEEIAAVMKCSAATARKHVQRARERLQVVLARHRPEHLQGA